MSISRAEIGLILLTLLLGALGIWLGTWDPLWVSLKVGPEMRGSLTLALSVFVVLAGFLPVIHLQQSKALEQHLGLQRSLLANIRAAAPHLSVFDAMAADDALAYLTSGLPAARCVWNTRVISEKAKSGYPTVHGDSYSKACMRAIRDGLIFRDVISSAWLPSARELSERAATAKGTYDFAVLEHDFPSFMNFIALEYQDGRREVIFGWAISVMRGFEQPCFRTSETRLVDFFQLWHSELFLAGSRGGGPTPQTGMEGRA